MGHSTGLKFKLGTTIKTANINIQAVPSKKDPVVLDAVTVTPGKGANNKQKLVIAAQGAVKKQNDGVVNKNDNFKKPFVAIQAMPLVQKSILANKNLKQHDLLKIGASIQRFKKSIELKGITEQRPEIIALTDFQPVYAANAGRRFNSVGEFLDLQIASRRLRIENIMRLLEALSENKDVNKLLDSLKDSYIGHINAARTDVEFLVAMESTLNRARNSLDVRKIVPFSAQVLGVKTRSFRTLFVDEMGFTEENYKEFSNTKIFSQFIFDFLTISSQYSPSLFDSFDADRQGDRSPVELAEKIDVTDGKFRFRVESFRSPNAQVLTNMGKTNTFAKFITQLPAALDDRAKLLITTLSKEYRVSAGLGDKRINQILSDTFGADSNDRDNPFNAILGRPGNKITDPPIGGSSMSSLLRFVTDDNEAVLPFEQAFVTDDNQRTFIPGRTFLVDGVLKGDQPFDLMNLKGYGKRFDRITSDAHTAFNTLFNLRDTGRNLFASDLWAEVLEDVLSAASQAVKEKNFKFGPLIPIALMRTANSDPRLKAMLFQYTLLLGFNGKAVGGEAGATAPSDFFERMTGAEIPQFSNMTELDGLQAPEPEPIESEFDIPDFFQPFHGGTPTSDILAIRSAIEALTDRIVKRTMRSVREGAKAKVEGGPIHFLTEDFREQIVDSRLFFREIGQFIDSLEAKVKSERGHLLTDETARSRYNFLTSSTIAAMAFEIYSAVATKYVDVGFSAATQGSIILKMNNDKIADIVTAITEALSSLSRRAKSGGPDRARKRGVLPERAKKNLPQQQNNARQQGYQTIQAKLNSAILSDSLNEVTEKLKEEDDLLREFVERMAKTNDRIVAAFDNVEEFFDPNGDNSTKLSALTDGIDADQKIPLISEAQTRLAQKELVDLEEADALSLRTKLVAKKKKPKAVKFGIPAQTRKPGPQSILDIFSKLSITKVDFPAFFDDSSIPDVIETMLFLLLDQRQYRRRQGENLKILSVGIPAGFTQNLNYKTESERSDFDEVGNKENDIVSIDVYRRDIEFEDIVFKPRSYIFEMSRFVSRSTFEENADRIGGSFNVAIDSHVFMRDFSQFVKGSKQSGANVFKNRRYDFLTQEEKEGLVENHISSFLLSVYVKLLTGVGLEENNYLVNTDLHRGFIDDDARNKFNELVEAYVSGIAGVPLTIEALKEGSPTISKMLNTVEEFGVQTGLTEQIDPPQIPGVPRSAQIEITEDLISFVKLFNARSLLTGGRAHRQRITSPKIFERIFNLPVDPDDFEIDVEQTYLTPTGKRTFIGLRAQGRLVERTRNGKTRFFIRPRRKMQDIEFDQFFVAIKTVGDFVI